jgi:hypothetical protein
MATNACFYGDSIMDTHPPAGLTTGGGQWCDLLCAYFGWTRVGGGSSSGDAARAAISGTSLEQVTPILPAQQSIAGFIPQTWAYDATNVTNRLAHYGSTVVGVDLGTNDYVWAGPNVNPVSFATAWDTLLPQINALPGLAAKFIVGMTNLPAHGQVTWPSLIGEMPSWATSLADAWAQLQQVIVGKAAQYGFVYVDVSGCPGSYLPDNVHPATATGQNYYFQQCVNALAGTLTGLKADPAWTCKRKYS